MTPTSMIRFLLPLAALAAVLGFPACSDKENSNSAAQYQALLAQMSGTALGTVTNSATVTAVVTTVVTSSATSSNTATRI